MPTTYEIRATGPLFESPDLLRQIDGPIVTTLSELGALGQRLVVDREPAGISSGGGGLRGSTYTEARGEPARREQRVSASVFYAPIVEAGRARGKRPPVTALYLWVQRKLGVGPDRVPSVAFVVARKIGRAGYQGYHMFERTFVQLQPIAEQRFRDLATNLTRSLGGS